MKKTTTALKTLQRVRASIDRKASKAKSISEHAALCAASASVSMAINALIRADGPSSPYTVNEEVMRNWVAKARQHDGR